MDYPKTDANARLHNDKFTDGDPVNGVPASRDSAAHQNMVFDEIINAITAGGETPDEAKSDQLATVIKRILSSGRVLGQPFWHLGETPPAGSLFFASQRLSRVDYPELWAALNEGDRNITFVSDADYLAGRRGFWSTGDGSTTFRSPDPRGLVLRVLDSGAGIDIDRVSGEFQSDAIRNITGSVEFRGSESGLIESPSGAIEYAGLTGRSYTQRMASDNAIKDGEVVNFNAANVVPTASENLMKNMAWPLAFWYE